MQIERSAGRIHCIGVPRAGDMHRITEHLAGIDALLEDVTWRG